jgi:hypothetical protein
MDKIIKENISRTWWALDEVIGKDTKYEGNNSINSLNQIIELLHKYKPIDKFDYINNIISDTLIIYKKTLTDLKDMYSDIYSNLPDSSIPTKLYINGWKGHLISIFIEYISDNIYNVGVINCGEGSDIHGFEDNHVFGIIVFRDITKIQIKSFDNYIIRYKNNDDDDDDDMKAIYKLILDSADRLISIERDIQMFDEHIQGSDERLKQTALNLKNEFVC